MPAQAPNASLSQPFPPHKSRCLPHPADSFGEPLKTDAIKAFRYMLKLLLLSRRLSLRKALHSSDATCTLLLPTELKENLLFAHPCFNLDLTRIVAKGRCSGVSVNRD